MVGCSVLGCKSRAEAMISSTSFHSFPGDVATRTKWIDATGRINWTPRKHSRMCSLHFDKNDIKNMGRHTYMLPYSVPSKHIGVVSEHGSTEDPAVKEELPGDDAGSLYAGSTDYTKSADLDDIYSLQETIVKGEMEIGPTVIQRTDGSLDAVSTVYTDHTYSLQETIVKEEICIGPTAIRPSDEHAGSLDAASTVKTEPADVDDVYSLEEETIVKEDMGIGPTVIQPPDEDAGSLDAASTVKTEPADVDDVYSLEEETIVKEDMGIGPTVIQPPDKDAGSLDAASTVKTGPADVDDVYSLLEETIVKEDMEIGPTVIQSPHSEYMPPPCKLESVDETAAGTTHWMELQNDCATDTYSTYSDETNKYTSKANEEDLRHFFENIIGPGTGIVETLAFESLENFFALVQCRLAKNEAVLTTDDYKQFIDEFINKYSKFTKFNWIARNSFPNLKRLVYRKVYVCQHSSFNKRTDRIVQRKMSPGQNCKAKIEFRVELLNNTFIRTAPVLRGYNIIIYIIQRHTHPTDTAEAFSLLKCDPKLNDTFNRYFEIGMTPTMARQFNETKLMEETQCDIAQVLSNGQWNPSDRHVQYLYKEWHESKCGKRTYKDFLEIIEDMKKSLTEHTIVNNDLSLVIIVTPIMKMMLRAEEAKVVYVDNSRCCHRTGSSITFFYTRSKVGAVPIACALHSEQNEVTYKLAFAKIKQALEKDTNLKFHPNIIMTDDSKAEMNALAAIFPGSRVLLSALHVRRSFWQWLCDTKNKVHREKRQSAMMAFSKILHANNAEQARVYYEEIFKEDYITSNASLFNHITKLWERRADWVVGFRNELPYDENDFTEKTIRIFKDTILQRCRAFNVMALAEYVTTIFENYQRRRLLSYSYNEPYDYTKLLFNREELTNVYSIGDNTFIIESNGKGNSFYTARLDTGFCDCLIGKWGTLCMHLCYIESKYGTLEKGFNLLEHDRVSLAKIAITNIEDVKFESNDTTVTCETVRKISSKEIMPIAHDPTLNESTVSEAATPGKSQKSSTAPELDADKFRNALDDLNKEFARLSKLFGKYPTPSNLKALQKLTSHIKNISTISEAQKFIFQDIKCNEKALKKIYVRPATVRMTGSLTRPTDASASRPGNEETRLSRKRKLK